MKFLNHFSRLKSYRFIYRQIQRDDIVNKYQGQNGHEWGVEAQNDLSHRVKKRTQEELSSLQGQVETPAKVLSVEVKRGDTAGAIVRGLLESKDFKWSLPVQYLSKKIKGTKPTILQETNLIYPGQIIKIRTVSGETTVYILDPGQDIPSLPKPERPDMSSVQPVQTATAPGLESEPVSRNQLPPPVAPSQGGGEQPPESDAFDTSRTEPQTKFEQGLYMGGVVGASERALRQSTLDRKQKQFETHIQQEVKELSPRVAQNQVVEEFSREKNLTDTPTIRRIAELKKIPGLNAPDKVEALLMDLDSARKLLETAPDQFRTKIERIANTYGHDFQKVTEEAMKMSELSGALAFLKSPAARKALKGVAVMGSFGFWNAALKTESWKGWNPDLNTLKTGNTMLDMGAYFVPFAGNVLDYNDMRIAWEKGEKFEAALSGISGTIGMVLDVISLTGVGAAPAQGLKLPFKAGIRGSIALIRRGGVGLFKKMGMVGELAKRGVGVVKSGLSKLGELANKGLAPLEKGGAALVGKLDELVKKTEDIPVVGKVLKGIVWTAKETISTIYNVATLKMLRGGDAVKASRIDGDQPQRSRESEEGEAEKSLPQIRRERIEKGIGERQKLIDRLMHDKIDVGDRADLLKQVNDSLKKMEKRIIPEDLRPKLEEQRQMLEEAQSILREDLGVKTRSEKLKELREKVKKRRDKAEKGIEGRKIKIGSFEDVLKSADIEKIRKEVKKVESELIEVDKQLGRLDIPSNSQQRTQMRAQRDKLEELKIEFDRKIRIDDMKKEKSVSTWGKIRSWFSKEKPMKKVIIEQQIPIYNRAIGEISKHENASEAVLKNDIEELVGVVHDIDTQIKTAREDLADHDLVVSLLNEKQGEALALLTQTRRRHGDMVNPREKKGKERKRRKKSRKKVKNVQKH